MKKVCFLLVSILFFALSSLATLTMTITTSSSGCTGPYNGTLMITVTAGSAPYQYSLNGGVTFVASNTFTGLPPGSYTATVIDVFGETGTGTAFVGSSGIRSYSSINASVCMNQLPYVFNGMNINNAGFYTDTLTSVTGCDSIISLSLDVISMVSSTENVFLCPSQLPYVWNGQSYNAAGTYSVTLTATSGCDSIVNLNLSITNTNEWIGTTSNVWENPANWSCGTIPTATTDVIINSGNVVVSANTTINSLTLAPAAILTISPGINLTVLH